MRHLLRCWCLYDGGRRRILGGSHVGSVRGVRKLAEASMELFRAEAFLRADPEGVGEADLG